MLFYVYLYYVILNNIIDTEENQPNGWKIFMSLEVGYKSEINVNAKSLKL
jgi:hypothetical protein